MPNNLDATTVLLNSVRSGFTAIYSGTTLSGIMFSVQITSGDTISYHTPSGLNTILLFRPGRTETKPLVGGTFTEIVDHVDIEVFVRDTTASGASLRPVRSTVKTRTDDIKVAVSSGTFTNPPRPILISEDWPMPHELVTKAHLTYRFKYLL